jgi:hypothetical protein
LDITISPQFEQKTVLAHSNNDDTVSLVAVSDKGACEPFKIFTFKETGKW